MIAIFVAVLLLLNVAAYISWAVEKTEKEKQKPQQIERQALVKEKD